MHFNRLMYLGYYVKKLNRPMFYKFLKYTKEQTGRSSLSICMSIVHDSLKYNISILEYFQFHFFEKEDLEKRKWAGTGYMYEYQGFMNPRKYRSFLEDKRKFNKIYAEFVKHISLNLEDTADVAKVQTLLANHSGKLVFKNSGGNCGKGIIVDNCGNYTPQSVRQFMIDHNYDMVEECVLQHEEFNRLSPSAVNTIRVFTQLDESDEVVFLGCRLRISVNSCVDNLAAGNLAAPIDINTGMICGPAVYSDITKPAETTVHPVTGTQIIGFQIPYWREVIDMVHKAAKVNTVNRTIGWDIAMTPNGPDMIEGNREWCKLLFQLPIHKGMKHELDNFLLSQKNKI